MKIKLELSLKPEKLIIYWIYIDGELNDYLLERALKSIVWKLIQKVHDEG